MTDLIVIGLDPSSKKIAMAISVNGEAPTVQTKALPPKNVPYACYVAYSYVRKVVAEYVKAGHTVFLFIEGPVVGRGGVYSTLLQTKMNGAMQGGAYAGGADVTEVNNSSWKKAVVGKGNCGKPEIKKWVNENWPYAYKLCAGDQDLMDAACILRHGEKVVQTSARIIKDMDMTVEPTPRVKPPRKRIAAKK